MAELGMDLGKVLLANIYNAAMANFGPRFLDADVVKQFVDGVETIKRGVEALRHVDYKRAVDLIDEALSLMQVIALFASCENAEHLILKVSCSLRISLSTSVLMNSYHLFRLTRHEQESCWRRQRRKQGTLFTSYLTQNTG